MIFKSGAASQSVDVQIVDDNGLAVTGLTYSTAPTIKYSLGGANADATISLVTLATVTTAWVSGGFIERGNGVYRLDVPNAALSSVGEVTLRAESSGQHLVCPRLMVVAFDPTSSTNLGLSSLPTASPAATGGLPTCDASAAVKANCIEWAGGAIPSPGTTGVPDVNSKYFGGTSQTGRDIGASVLLSQGTGNGQILLSTGYVSAGTLSAALSIAITNGRLLIATGTTSPASATAYFPSTYGGVSYYNNQFVYNSVGTLYLWYDSTYSLWTLSTGVGVRGSAYFTCTTLAGTYSPGGTATGNPVVTSISEPVDPNWGNAKFDSSGCIYSNLQSVLSNVVTVDSNSYLNVNTKDIAGFAATLDGNNLLKVDVEDVRGSASQGAAGYVGTDQSKITNATATVALTNTTVGTATNLTNAGPDTTGTTTLLSRVTSSRASYLDNLNVGGNVASHADVLAINTSSSKHLLLSTVGQYAPSEAYTIECRTFSASDGSSVNADSNPTLTVTGSVSGSLAANLGSITNPATGVYRWTYTVPSSPTLEQIRVDVSATISSATFTLSAYTQTVDSPTAVWSSTQATQLTAIYNKLPANNIADETLLIAAIGSPMQAGATVNTYANSTETAIKAKSDLIGTNSMDSANSVTANSNIATITGKLPTNNIADETLVIAAINALPTSVPTAAQIRQEIDSNSTKLASAATAANVTTSTNTIVAAIGGLGSGQIVLNSPLSADGGTLTITQGDDLYSADYTAAVWTIPGTFPSLTSATAVLRLSVGGASATVSGVSLATVTGGITATAQIPNATSIGLLQGTGIFQIAITWADGHSYTYVQGALVVNQKAA